MIFECLYGHTPWPAVRSIKELKTHMEKDGKVKNFPTTPKISDEMKRVIQIMTIVKPYNKRPTA